jgi:hypothetical protein
MNDDEIRRLEEAIMAARQSPLLIGADYGDRQLQYDDQGRGVLAEPSRPQGPSLEGPRGPRPMQPEPQLEQVPPSPRRTPKPRQKTPEELAKEADEMMNRMRSEHEGMMKAPTAVEDSRLRSEAEEVRKFEQGPFDMEDSLGMFYAKK